MTAGSSRAPLVCHVTSDEWETSVPWCGEGRPYGVVSLPWPNEGRALRSPLLPCVGKWDATTRQLSCHKPQGTWGASKGRVWLVQPGMYPTQHEGQLKRAWKKRRACLPSIAFNELGDPAAGYTWTNPHTSSSEGRVQASNKERVYGFKFKASGTLLIVLDKFVDCISNYQKRNRKMSTLCNWLDLEMLGSRPTMPEDPSRTSSQLCNVHLHRLVKRMS